MLKRYETTIQIIIYTVIAYILVSFYIFKIYI